MRIDTPSSNKSRAQRLGTQISIMFLLGFVMIYIGSSYLQRSTFENLLSFFGPDGPGQLPNVVLPKPFGFHFFGDFLLPQWQSQLPDPWIYKDPTGPPITNYFPFTMTVFWLFSQISYWKSFLIFLFSSLALIFYPMFASLKSISRLERTQIIIGSVLLTGPMISLLDRGNIQLLLLGLCLMAIYQFGQERYTLSAILFGLTIGLKIYPIIFLILFIRRHNWKSLCVSLTTGILTTILPLFYYGDGVVKTLRSILENVQINDSVYLRGYLCYNNSIKGSLVTIESLGIPLVSRLSTITLTHYSLIVLALLAISLLIFLDRMVTTAEILLVCSALMCTLATYVAPYVLGIYFVAILWLWKDSARIPSWALITYGWLLAILLMPRGLPLKFWSTDFAFSTPTYTSLLGGPCSVGIILIVFARSLRHNNLRRILRLDLLKNGPVFD